MPTERLRRRLSTGPKADHSQADQSHGRAGFSTPGISMLIPLS